MAININGSNGFSQLNALRNNPNTEYGRIASGNRINSAADDAAGLAIANRMTSQENGYNVAIRNAGDGISLSQLASGALNSITDNLQRVRELSLQAANGSLNADDRKGIQQEINQRLDDTNRLLEDTSFNGVKLFDSESSLNFQTGPEAGDNVSVSSTDLKSTLDSLGLQDVSALTADGATSALSVIDDAISAINEDAAEYGAVSNRFESTIQNLSQSRESIAEARSRISDTDIAKEVSSLISKDIRNQIDIAVQSQANGNRQNVLRLLS